MQSPHLARNNIGLVFNPWYAYFFVCHPWSTPPPTNPRHCIATTTDRLQSLPSELSGLWVSYPAFTMHAMPFRSWSKHERQSTHNRT